MREFNYEKLLESKWDVETVNLLSKIHEHISKASIENSLKQLIEEEYIHRYGKGRATYYVINN